MKIEVKEPFDCKVRNLVAAGTLGAVFSCRLPPFPDCNNGHKFPKDCPLNTGPVVIEKGGE